MTQQHHGENPFMQIEDWVIEILMSDELTKTDHRLFWYLFKLERWGDKFVDLPSQAEIALELGVRRETINQSQAKLQKLRLWDFKITSWKARNLVGPKSNRVLEKSNRVLEKSNRVLEKSNRVLEKSNSSIYIDHARVQTLTDFLKTLSDSERENFLEFGRKKASQLPQPPELPDKWVAANWEELRSQWEASAVGRQVRDEAVAAAMDWANHPHFDEWLNKCYFVGRLWTMEDSPDQAERSAFFAWAQKTNAYVGRIDGAT